MAWQLPRAFWAYLILQVPDILLAGLVLLLAHRWVGLSSGWAIGLFALWVAKDVGTYFLLRDAFTPPRTGPETLVGARAVVTEPLAPEGQVRVGAEHWRAESLRPDEVTPHGTRVIVRATRGLTLLVEGESATDPQDGQRDLP